MERKTIRISSKQQVTIPQRYFERLAFGEEAECTFRGDELVIRLSEPRAAGSFPSRSWLRSSLRGTAASSCWNSSRQSRKRCAPLWSA